MTPAEQAALRQLEALVRERLPFGHGNAAFWGSAARAIALLDAERARARAAMAMAARSDPWRRDGTVNLSTGVIAALREAETSPEGLDPRRFDPLTIGSVLGNGWLRRARPGLDRYVLTDLGAEVLLRAIARDHDPSVMAQPRETTR